MLELKHLVPCNSYVADLALLFTFILTTVGLSFSYGILSA